MYFVETTVANEPEAERLAKLAIAGGEAACVSLVAVRSIYRWQGAVSDQKEWLLRFKTTASRVSSLGALLRREHAYEVPEIINYSAEVDSPAYARWLEET